jgi:hypothetical protein
MEWWRHTGNRKRSNLHYELEHRGHKNRDGELLRQQ